MRNKAAGEGSPDGFENHPNPDMKSTHTKVALCGASPQPPSFDKGTVERLQSFARQKSVGQDGRKVATVGQAAHQRSPGSLGGSLATSMGHASGRRD